ncbi:MAG TPA: DNA-binding response regulator [Planctomycetes bacterium]|nr:DNA-binding response regulator [Planctomycetota bacterium]
MNGTYNNTMKNNKGKLLLADAKSGLREAMTRNLQKAGYGVLQARDAHEALRLLGSQAVETMFVDEDLPGLPLAELAKKAHQISPSVKIVVFSRNADQAIQELAPAGVYDVLQMPVSEPRLLLSARQGTERVQGPPAPEPRPEPQRDQGEILPFREEEKRIIERALRITGGNIQQTARALKLGRATIYRKLRKYDIHPRLKNDRGE